MRNPPVVIALPIADRAASYSFFRDALGFDPVGEPAEDGVPEPLQFALGADVNLMLVPSEGFGWVVAGHEVAQRGHSECVVNIARGSEAEVDELVERAREAGAEILAEPFRQPWGYVGTFADLDGHVWMVTAQPPSA